MSDVFLLSAPIAYLASKYKENILSDLTLFDSDNREAADPNDHPLDGYCQLKNLLMSFHH